jgi:hypothetical protein
MQEFKFNQNDTFVVAAEATIDISLKRIRRKIVVVLPDRLQDLD